MPDALQQQGEGDAAGHRPGVVAGDDDHVLLAIGFRHRAERAQALDELYSAVTSLVCSLVGMLVAGVILGVLALVFGAVALGQIKESNGLQKGKGMAIAGMIIGPIAAVLAVIVIADSDLF